ncbi:transferrin-binding protein-like solute binding protein [Pasteurellaceae bacterium 20609_3]|nr:transferrin-binding protein-like solute binding protein [Spirabiliibacterium mucosae]
MADALKESDFLQKGEIDPQKAQYLEVKADDGTLLGKFQFVNQSYSSYATFVPEMTRIEYGEHITPENVALFVANPTTEAQFAQQKGTATYSGHTLGYVDGPDGKTPTQGYMGDVNLNVNFDTKMIDGKVTARQDGFTKYNWRYTDDDDMPTQKGIDLTKQDLILKPTKIEVSENGTMSFGKGASDNVAWMDGDKEVASQNYGGTFAGPNADEIVGQIGGGEERIAFGASRDK